MKDYINQFKKNYQEARKLKEYIYSLSISEKTKRRYMGTDRLCLYRIKSM